MAALTVVSASATGATVSMVAAAGGGDTFVNDGDAVLIVTNGGGGSINVTITPASTTPQGYTISPVVVAVAAGATKYIGPFDKNTFNNPTTGAVSVTYSGVTTVTVGVLGKVELAP